MRWGACEGTIVETEAYSAIGDEACHCFMRPSSRAFVARNEAGRAYVYFNYGVHWMLNVLVKGMEDGFVLIRALEPTKGVPVMKRRRGMTDERQLCSGPGKLTQALAINGKHHEMDLCADERFCFTSPPSNDVSVVADGRIGVTRAAEFPWRFTLRHSKFVSRKPRASV